MEHLVRDQGLCERLGAAAQIRVKQVYSWTQKAEKLNQFYHQILHVKVSPITKEQKIRCEF